MNNVEKNNAEPITPKDDAFHGSPKRLAAEWWYFDASFNDDISIHIGLKTFTRKNKGFIMPLIEIYHKGKLTHIASTRYLFKNANISSEMPKVKIFDKSYIAFDKERYDETGEWCYHITFKIDELHADLLFVGCTQGWKIQTPQESWTVALPKAKVTGTLGIKERVIPVEGMGYHDHNWNYSLLTALNYGKGWYWGKIRSDTITITWANIVKSSKRSEILAVVNQDGKGFFNVHPSSISFKPQNSIKDHRRRTPTEFLFRIQDSIDHIPMNTDVMMKTTELHFSKVLFAPYWRYHVHAVGNIAIGDKTEPVSDIQIMEYLQFDMF